MKSSLSSSSHRNPGETTDQLVHYDDSKHIVVLHRGRYFRVWVYSDGKYLEPSELEYTINLILEDKSSR